MRDQCEFYFLSQFIDVIFNVKLESSEHNSVLMFFSVLLFGCIVCWSVLDVRMVSFVRPFPLQESYIRTQKMVTQ